MGAEIDEPCSQADQALDRTVQQLAKRWFVMLDIHAGPTPEPPLGSGPYFLEPMPGCNNTLPPPYG